MSKSLDFIRQMSKHSPITEKYGEILWNSFNPQGSASPIVTASHDKNNVRIVWWYNILTAEFRYSKTSTALHCDKKFIDIFNDIGSRRSWLQGRVFSYCGKIYTLIYMFNHKTIPSDTLKNLLFKLNSCLNDDEQIVSVFDENGDNLSDMFESKSLASDPKEFLACVESFSSYGYKIPDDPETLVYDFYLMSTLPFPKDIGLVAAFTEAKEKLYTYLKESMQNVLLFSIFLEFTHIDTLTKSDEFSEYFRDKGVPEFPDRFLAISNDSEDGLNFCRRLIKEFSGSIPIISAIADSFEDLAWPINFGGKAWRAITKTYISLYTTPKTDLGMLQVWIDRVFDLEHNTGKLVDKTNFFDVDGDTGWLRVALSFKFFSRSAFEFLDKASLDLVRLTTAILKDVYGWTYEDWIAKKTHGGMKEGTRVSISQPSFLYSKAPRYCEEKITEAVVSDHCSCRTGVVEYVSKKHPLPVNFICLIRLDNGDRIVVDERGVTPHADFNLSEDWKSGLVAAGLAGATLLNPVQAQAAPVKTEQVETDNTVAMVIAGEAAGEGYEGMKAVACVIQNRMKRPKRFGSTAKGIAIRRGQFSAYDDKKLMAKNFKAVKKDAIEIASKIGTLEDITGGADHYVATWFYNKVKDNPKHWVSKMTVTKTIGNHVFLKEKI